ncbi:copper resistance CopC family protein [Rhodococcus pyridinivorans]|uniref:copper resistance CopC family protein n=1 Tax=Rhodococcus pyridinivorans TaxID=103816 RepID=UPI00190393D2|nr:copper resistance CopC family protein [Rhodococcus pyridinivorans]QQM55667.1 copper resistance protein CopC [Rhodococcus pyridinivorans]
MTRLLAIFVAAAAVLLLGVAPAQAHSTLIGSTPAADAAVASSPDGIELEFNQPINPAFATVTLTDGAGTQRGSSEAIVDAERVRLAIPEPLTAGEYTVGYRVVSADGHPITGSYAFTVTAAAGQAPTAEAQAAPPSSGVAEPETTGAQAAPEDAQSSGSSTPLLLGFAVLGVLALAGGTWAAMRAFRKS